MLEQLNAVGKITAAEAPKGDDAAKADTSLPDPTRLAKVSMFGLIVFAGVLAWVLNLGGWATPEVPFKPAEDEEANFALFAGFYVAAQVIVALMALFSPLLPLWRAPADITDSTARAAQLKADRVLLTLGLSTVFGVAISCTFGLFFLEAVGFDVSHTVDAIATGLVIAGGAKPLKDFIATLQNQTTPKTTTTTGESTRP